MNRFFQTDQQSWVLFVQRVVLALVMLPHGAQKLLGWFGGYGFSGTMGFFTDTMHIPAPIALLVILGESIGAVMLALGLGTRLSAFGISAIMAGAILTSHAQHGFFMNWFGNQQGEGIEFHLLALALGVPLLIWGGGRYAMDSLVERQLGTSPVLTPVRAR
jgi:putative oxidoreductase